MRYYVTRDDGGEIVGYSTYRQFEGQEYTDDIPPNIKRKNEQMEEYSEKLNFLGRSDYKILKYLENDLLDRENDLSTDELLKLCDERANARKCINKLKESK